MRFTFAATLFALVSSVLSAPVSPQANRYAGLARSDEPASLAKRECTTIPDKPDWEMVKIVYKTVLKHSDDPKIMLCTFVTAWRESHFNNLNCGDRESFGLFQQQSRYNWGSYDVITNPVKSTESFLNVLLKIYPANKNKGAGELAQIVQVAIAGNRYTENEDYGRELIAKAKQLVGDDSGAPADSGKGDDKNDDKDDKPTSTKPSGNGGAINVGGKPPAATPTKSQDGPKETQPPTDGPSDDGEDCECTRYYVPVPGDICHSVAAKFDLKLDELYELNPQIDSECQNLYAGQKYCVSTDPADAADN